MEIKNLEIILALDSAKHFNRAAEKLNISQPALSMKLKSLENEIGVKLVKRGKNFIGLTKEGEILKEKFKFIVKEYSEIKQLSSELKNNLTGSLRVGVIPSALIDVSSALNEYVKKYRNINIQVHSMSSNKIDEGLHDFKLDIGFSYLDNEPILGVEKIHLYKEKYFLVTQNKKYEKLKHISWSECGGLDLCLISQENQFRRILDAIFKSKNISPNIMIESNSLIHLFSHVSSSDLSTIMPGSYASQFKNVTNLLFIELDTPTVTHSIGSVFIKDKGPSPIKDSFIKFLKNFDK
ncbi:LysR family transcriptional regulator [Alphaproteobacteria bacterium]|jgi:DNA-binding transcriptional LysR family regulator|nr:LysR family transcriptional regulator [Alphaproteobacteria bacterium]